MRNTALMIVLVLFGMSVSSPAQVSLRFGKTEVSVGGTCRPVTKCEPRIPRRVATTSRHGHYEYVRERVWMEGYHRRVWRDAEYGVRYDACGHEIRFVIRPAGYEKVWVPGRYEYRTRKVWVPERRVRVTSRRHRY